MDDKPDDLVDLEIDGHVYSGLTRAQAERLKRWEASGKTEGFGLATPLPTDGPKFSGFHTAAEVDALLEAKGIKHDPVTGRVDFSAYFLMRLGPPKPGRKPKGDNS